MDFQEDPALKGVYFSAPTKITENDAINDLELSDNSSDSDSDSDSSSTSSSSSSSSSISDNVSVCDSEFAKFEPLKIVIPGLAAELSEETKDNDPNVKVKNKTKESKLKERSEEYAIKSGTENE